MRLSHAAASLLLLIGGARLPAQQVDIANATPGAVVELLKGYLLPDGFKFERANDRSALFTLDRGLRAQRQGPPRPVVLELHLQFRQRRDVLRVRAYEDVVSDAGRSFEFRQRVQSPDELDSVQRLLERVRSELMARQPPSDSAAKPPEH